MTADLVTGSTLSRQASAYRLLDYVFHIESWRMISVRSSHESNFGRADFLHRLLGTKVPLSDKEHDVFNKLERVRQQ